MVLGDLGEGNPVAMYFHHNCSDVTLHCREERAPTVSALGDAAMRCCGGSPALSISFITGQSII
jgi:hypothetical protein